jgi:hypothetical protein
MRKMQQEWCNFEAYLLSYSTKQVYGINVVCVRKREKERVHLDVPHHQINFHKT